MTLMSFCENSFTQKDQMLNKKRFDEENTIILQNITKKNTSLEIPFIHVNETLNLEFSNGKGIILPNESKNITNENTSLEIPFIDINQILNLKNSIGNGIISQNEQEKIRKENVLLGVSFFAINTSYASYSVDPLAFFKPYFRNRICYFKKKSYAFALIVLDWRKWAIKSKGVYYMKPSIIKSIMSKLNPPWLFYMDSDLEIVDRNRNLTDYINDTYNIIFNDHNAALNNGAFFIKNSYVSTELLNLWEDFSTDRLMPQYRWPFTDNGAMIEAVIRVSQEEDSQCLEPQVSESDFIQCVHRILTKLSGKEFDGVSNRILPKNIVLSHSVGGFNNHRCKTPPDWGWSTQACYSESSMILHTKIFEYANDINDDSCKAADIFESMELKDGTIVFLPDSDFPCFLEEDNSCLLRAKAFYDI